MNQNIMYVIVHLMAAMALLVVVFNYVAIYQYNKNKRLGIPKHVSMVPVVSQILLFLSWQFASAAKISFLPIWAIASVALLDPWILVYTKIFIARSAKQ